MKCSLCDREAKVFQPHYGRALCYDCFIEDIRARAREYLRKMKISGRIMLAVSGGKDSFVLSDVMMEIYDRGKLIAFNVEEGIRGYNREGETQDLERKLMANGVELIRLKAKEVLGFGVDDVYYSAMKKGLNCSACTFCGDIRRKMINKVARELNASYVATGHNLDDEVQTILINLLSGDKFRIARAGEEFISYDEYFVPRIKPLRRVYEWETTMYSFIRSFKFQEVECPHITQRPTIRAKVRELLYNMELFEPGISLKILDFFDSEYQRIREKLELRKWEVKLPKCEICGEPTSIGRKICKGCELVIASGFKGFPKQNIINKN
jgi:uncharacterized protein (TIGR00269 family)